MKLVLFFLTILTINFSFASIDRIEVPFRFNDQVSNEVVVLVKEGKTRSFFICNTNDSGFDRDSCEELVSYKINSVHEVEDRYEIDSETPFYHKLGRYVLTPIGTGAGFIVGAFGAIIVGGGGTVAAPGPGTVAGTIAGISILAGATTGGGALGYKVGSLIDGSPFSDEETISILNTLGHEQVLSDSLPQSGSIQVDLSIQDFLEQLEIASSLID